MMYISDQGQCYGWKGMNCWVDVILYKSTEFIYFIGSITLEKEKSVTAVAWLSQSLAIGDSAGFLSISDFNFRQRVCI